MEIRDQGIYLSDGLKMCVPPQLQEYTLPFLQSSLPAEKFASSEKLQAVLETTAMVELATELASVWESTVDHSGSTMCWKPV